MADKLDWDDLRVALAIADEGSLAAAARALKVNQSTALRRLDALERRLATRLFERQRSGYVPTEAGDLLTREAREIAPRIDELERRLLGRDLRAQGHIRITTGLVVMTYLLPEPLAAFARAHPGIEVEVAESAALLDLSRRQADVALRISQQVPDHWIGRALGDVRFRAYARRDRPEAQTPPRPLAQLLDEADWVSFERDGGHNRFGRWMNAHIPPDRVRARCDAFSSVAVMLRTGIGVGLLPTFAQPTEPLLVPVSDEVEALRTPMWLLTHPDLRRTTRVRCFMREVGDALAARLADHDSAPRRDG